MAFLGHRLPTDNLKTNLRARSRFLVVGACVCAMLIAAPRSRAQEGASEYEVKAAFLFNFVKFIEWPDDAFTDSHSPIVIGILGQDPFEGAMDRTISGKSVNSRPLVVKRLSQAHEARSCHIVFVCSSEKKRLAQIFGSLVGANVLTVSETDDFLRAGGAINFVIENHRVRFEVNTIAAHRARLKISSKLLQLARTVVR